MHILNCVSMSPWFPRWQLGGTCLLVDTDKGAVLVDTGLGLHDYSDPSAMVRFFRADFGIENDPENTALRQVMHLGYSPDSITHIIMTHLHFDHAGGIPDFPQAKVHVHQRELQAMLHPSSLIELAYDRADFLHDPSWITYDEPDTTWLDFDAIRLPFCPEMYLIPLFGHTKGHCGVAIRSGSGWVFNCADALPTNAQFDLLPQWLSRMAIGPHVPHLKDWSTAHPDVHLLAGHMWKSFFDPQKSNLFF